MCPAHSLSLSTPRAGNLSSGRWLVSPNLSPATLTEEPVLPEYGESKAQGAEDSPFVSQELQFFMLCL